MADERGSVSISDRALTRIARQVVTHVPGVSTAEPGRVGRTLGGGLPRVRWQRAGNRARVQVEVAIAWPASAAHVARDVQDALRRELVRLAGQDVAQVDVAVRDVVRSAAAPVARVR